MTLKFCPKCKTFIVPQKKNNKFFVKCLNCGFSKDIKEQDKLITNEKVESPKIIGKGVVKDENKFATYKHKCKKCGYNKAQVLDLGIFYSDEDNLILLKCGKCGYSERIGKKTS